PLPRSPLQAGGRREVQSRITFMRVRGQGGGGIEALEGDVHYETDSPGTTECPANSNVLQPGIGTGFCSYRPAWIRTYPPSSSEYELTFVLQICPVEIPSVVQ